MRHVWAAHMYGTSLLLLFGQLNNCCRSASHAVEKNRWNVALVLDCMQKTLEVVSSELGLPRTACGLGKDGYPRPGILAREAQVVIGLKPYPNNSFLPRGLQKWGCQTQLRLAERLYLQRPP
jgi:hypothetical protein